MKLSLKAARVNAGFTQNDVAKRLRVTKETIRKWERNVTSAKIGGLIEMCKIYGCGIDDIDFTK